MLPPTWLLVGTLYEVPSFLFPKMQNLCSFVFSTSNSVIFGDMYKTYDKAIIKLWFHSRMYNLNIAYNALNSVLVILYWNHMLTEACINTTNRIEVFGACGVLLNCFFVLFLCLLTVFWLISIFQNFQHKQGDSRNVSRPVASILMEANIGHLPTKFGYNQMQGWKVINRYRILQVNFHILPHLTFDLLMWPLTQNITEANIGTY